MTSALGLETCSGDLELELASSFVLFVRVMPAGGSYGSASSADDDCNNLQVQMMHDAEFGEFVEDTCKHLESFAVGVVVAAVEDEVEDVDKMVGRCCWQPLGPLDKNYCH